MRRIQEFFQGNLALPNELDQLVQLFNTNDEFKGLVNAFMEDDELTDAQRVSLWANYHFNELLPRDILPASLTNEFNKPYKDFFDVYSIDFFPPTADEEQRSLYKSLLMDYRSYFIDHGVFEVSDVAPFVTLTVEFSAPSLKIYLERKQKERKTRDTLESKWHTGNLGPVDYVKYSEAIGISVEELKQMTKESDAEHRQWLSSIVSEQELSLRKLRNKRLIERELRHIEFLNSQQID